MRCKICGASCRCRHAGPGICCSCHSHKASARRMSPTTDLKRALEIWEIAHGFKTLPIPEFDLVPDGVHVEELVDGLVHEAKPGLGSEHPRDVVLPAVGEGGCKEL